MLLLEAKERLAAVCVQLAGRVSQLRDAFQDKIASEHFSPHVVADRVRDRVHVAIEAKWHLKTDLSAFQRQKHRLSPAELAADAMKRAEKINAARKADHNKTRPVGRSV